MKTMKTIASLLLVLVMIFALATTAFAAGTNTITVNNTVKDETYTIYKMLDLVVDNPDNPTAFSYTVADGWENFFGTDGTGAGYVEIDNGYVTWKDANANMVAFGQAAAAYAKTLNVAGIPATGDSVTFENLDNGYYLITSTLGTQAIVNSTPTNSNAGIKEKNPEDTINKEVKEDSTEMWGESNDAQIGDTVNFKSTAILQPYTTNVKIYDTMDSGLSYTTDSVEIADLTKGTEYTVEENKTIDGVTYAFVITFTENYLATLNSATTLNLTYTAVLNENAVANNAIKDQTNKTKITYGDKQSVEDQTITTTHNFNVFKHAKDSDDNLAGAKFQLKNGENIVNLYKIDVNNYRVAVAGDATDKVVTEFITVAQGDIVIWGVDDDDTYTLVETEAPEGYNKLNAPINVTFEGTDTRIDVENKSGTELPSTGGMGTTLFYIVGGVLVAAAVVLLVTKKRMASSN